MATIIDVSPRPIRPTPVRSLSYILRGLAYICGIGAVGLGFLVARTDFDSLNLFEGLAMAAVGAAMFSSAVAGIGLAIMARAVDRGDRWVKWVLMLGVPVVVAWVTMAFVLEGPESINQRWNAFFPLLPTAVAGGGAFYGFWRFFESEAVRSFFGSADAN